MPICACLGGSSAADAVKKGGQDADAPPPPAEPVPSMRDLVKSKVYVTRNIHEDAIDILKERYEVEVWQSENKVPRDKFLNDVKDVSAIICTIADKIDDEVLSAAGPSLKIICSMTSGLSHVDEDACTSKEVALHHVADLCADVNAELTIALLLTVARRCMEGIDAVKAGEWGLWKPMWICGTEMTGRTLGILGFGRVGLGVARRLQPFGISRVIYFDKNEHPQAADVNAQLVETADEIFTESDFIVCCLSLTPETRNFINAENLALCKPECILVNSARAELINQDDLLTCLEKGGLAGAGLDVTTPEPLPPTHPLLQLPNCVVLPHMGTATTATRRRMAVHLANKVVDTLN